MGRRSRPTSHNLDVRQPVAGEHTHTASEMSNNCLLILIDSTSPRPQGLV